MANLIKNKNLFPVILCGGFGTRLWPLSRKCFPKQFVKIFGNQSLLQQTVNHFLTFNTQFKIPEFIFVTNEEHRFILENQIKEINLKKYKIIREKLKQYSEKLLKKKEIVVFNKIDLLEEKEKNEKLTKFKKFFKKKFYEISILNKQNINTVLRAIS